MGKLVNGNWVNIWYDTSKTKGKFIRETPQFRHWVAHDGSTGFKAEAGRYHLYVSLACPWAHRTLIFRHIKGLENIISLSIVNPHLGKMGGPLLKDLASLLILKTMQNIYTKSIYKQISPTLAESPCQYSGIKLKKRLSVMSQPTLFVCLIMNLRQLVPKVATITLLRFNSKKKHIPDNEVNMA